MIWNPRWTFLFIHRTLAVHAIGSGMLTFISLCECRLPLLSDGSNLQLLDGAESSLTSRESDERRWAHLRASFIDSCLIHYPFMVYIKIMQMKSRNMAAFHEIRITVFVEPVSSSFISARNRKEVIGEIIWNEFNSSLPFKLLPFFFLLQFCPFYIISKRMCFHFRFVISETKSQSYIEG